jgi:uncharacterized protein YkwD
MDTQFLSEPRPVHLRNLSARLVATGLVGILVVAGIALGGPSASASVVSTSAAQAYPAMAASTYESRVQRLINHRRTAHNLGHLRLATCTDDAAERWSTYLASNNLFYHQDMGDLLNRCDAMYAGETLGRGAISPRTLVRLWMHSSGHRAVLLSSQSRRIGIGAKPDAYGQWVVAANFMRF